MRGARGVSFPFFHTNTSLPQQEVSFAIRKIAVILTTKKRKKIKSVWGFDRGKPSYFNLASRPVSIGDFSKAGFFVSFSSMEKVKYKFTSTKSNNLFQQINRKQKTIRTHKHTPDPSLRGELLSITLKKLYSSRPLVPLYERGQGCVIYPLRSLSSPLREGLGVCNLPAPPITFLLTKPNSKEVC